MAKRGKVKLVPVRDVVERPVRSRKYRYLMLIVCENFDQAFVKAESEKIRIAYSNECFELWLLLHFCGVNEKEPIPRSELYSRLAAAISKHDQNFVYDHGDATVLSMVRKYGNEAKALERAHALDVYHQKENHAPIDSNPRTLVYQLVNQLRQWFAFYSYK